MSFLKEPEYNHGDVGKIGVLLINLGTPESPTTNSVRKYLKQFLSDNRVIEVPKFIWWFILNLIILRLRPSKSAKKYKSIWTNQGSPLKVNTRNQANLVFEKLKIEMQHPVHISYAMRYGAPSIKEKIFELKEKNCTKILFIPLYPQYSSSTTATVYDEISKVLKATRNIPSIRFLKHFHDSKYYIDSCCKQIVNFWKEKGKPEKLLMSFHGLPKFSLIKGDPYHCECHKTARLISEKLEYDEKDIIVSFQSRFGPAKWLEPYTIDCVKDLAKSGTKRLDVFCPGFVSDCLETLEEIQIENKEEFILNGGIEFNQIPCLNSEEHWVENLSKIVLQHLAGFSTRNFEEIKNDSLKSKTIAKKLGAEK